MGMNTYDPAQVSIVAFGIPISGYADGTFVSVEQNEDSFSLSVGADGDACRAKTNNRSGRITLTLLQSSLSNDLLTAQHALDILSPNGDGIGPFLMKDNSGRSLYAAEKAWIVKPATSAFGRDVESREWIIESDNLLQSVGGNS